MISPVAFSSIRQSRTSAASLSPPVAEVASPSASLRDSAGRLFKEAPRRCQITIFRYSITGGWTELHFCSPERRPFLLRIFARSILSRVDSRTKRAWFDGVGIRWHCWSCPKEKQLPALCKLTHYLAVTRSTWESQGGEPYYACLIIFVYLLTVRTSQQYRVQHARVNPVFDHFKRDG